MVDVAGDPHVDVMPSAEEVVARAMRGKRSSKPTTGSIAESYQRMLEKGCVLGIGDSTSLGWFRIEGFDADTGFADISVFVRSCTEGEREVAYRGGAPEYLTCTPRECRSDTLRQLVLPRVHTS